jgi:type VI secretion system protein ImpA
VSAPSLIDVDALMAPIPGATPVGSDPRYLPAVDRIKAARREAESEAGTASEQAKWAAVADLSAEVLQNSAKDLQCAVWLTEALARVEGFRGAEAGFAVLRRLLETWWDGCFPAVDAEDPEPLAFRLGIMTWLEERMPQVLKGVPVTGPPNAYTLLHYDATQRTGKERQALTEDGWPTTEQFEAALFASPLPFLEQALDAVRTCEAELTALERVTDLCFVERRTTPDGQERTTPLVSLRTVKDTVNSAAWLLDRAAAQKRPATAGVPGAPGGPTLPATAVPADGSDASAAARVAVQSGQLGGLQMLQQRVSSASCGRDRFLRLLEFAEVALEAGLQSLAQPIFAELAQTVDTRTLEGWEEHNVLIRVFNGLARSSRSLAALVPDLATKATEADDRIARLTAGRAS